MAPSQRIIDKMHALRIKLRDARHTKGMTQDDVADYLSGVPGEGASRRSWVSRLETGRSVPEVPTLIGYADAVGLELVLVARPQASLLNLTGEEALAVLRAARTASYGQLLTHPEAYRVRTILMKLSAQ